MFGSEGKGKGDETTGVVSVLGPRSSQQDHNPGRFLVLPLLEAGEPAWHGGHVYARVEGAQFLSKGPEGEVGGDAMYNHLYKPLVGLEGEGFGDEVEVLTDLAVKIGSGEVFHQCDGHVAGEPPAVTWDSRYYGGHQAAPVRPRRELARRSWGRVLVRARSAGAGEGALGRKKISVGAGEATL